jgi:hypothetical protein
VNFNKILRAILWNSNGLVNTQQRQKETDSDRLQLQTATNASKVASTFIFDSSKLPNQSNLITLGLMERKKENYEN